MYKSGILGDKRHALVLPVITPGCNLQPINERTAMRTKHGIIIILNIGVFFLASTISSNLLLYLAALVTLATIAFFFYIKLFERESMLFHDISIKQALIVMAIMIVFIVAGIIHKNNFINSVVP